LPWSPAWSVSRVAELDKTYPGSAELVVQAVHDRCRDTDTGKFRLPPAAECTEIAREQITKLISEKHPLKVERKVFGVPMLFL